MKAEVGCGENEKTPEGDSMRFMVIVKATKDSEAGKMPDEKNPGRHGQNSTKSWSKPASCWRAKAFRPVSKGAKVKFVGNKRLVTDGPFPRPKS